jgi:DNA-binding CsgD family transcriptional regulator
VFAGGWSLEAAEAVCGAADVLDGLARLVDRSLVIAEHGRYRLLETIRQFALECLAASGQLEAALERHALYWLELVERVEPELKRINQATWFRHLETEHDNLRAALRWSVASNRADIGLRIAIAVQRFWEVRGYWSEARRWLQELLTHQQLSAQPGSRMARAVGYLGFWVYLRGDSRLGTDLLTDSLVLAEAAGDASAKAFALHGLGQALSWQGQNDRARQVCEQSLATARTLNDGWAIARVLSRLGIFARLAGNFDEARALQEEGLAIARRTGERRIGSTLMQELGMLALNQDDLDSASVRFRSALEIKHELGDRSGESLIQRGLGWVGVERQDYRTACHHFGQVLAITGVLGMSVDRPNALIGFAIIATLLGQPERAVRLWAAAVQMTIDAGQAVADLVAPRSRPGLEAARARVGDTAAAALWATGLALSAEELDAEVEAVTRAAAAPGQPTHPGGLTDRELEVLRLLAGGMTDREIAADLVLSDKTVGRHLEHIYTKLGLSSRAAASAFAVRHGLA